MRATIIAAIIIRLRHCLAILIAAHFLPRLPRYSEETNAAILALSKNGIPIKQIMRQTGHSRKLVRQVIRGERTDVFRTRQSSLDLHLPWLGDQWASGCRNGAELWRRLKARGFRGSLRVISEWATRRRRAERPTQKTFSGFRRPEQLRAS